MSVPHQHTRAAGHPERPAPAGTNTPRRIRSWPSVVTGFGIPALALLGGVFALSGTGTRVLGLPVLYLWVFCCFPLTTLCLWVSWHVFDRPYYREAEGAAGQSASQSTAQSTAQSAAKGDL